ncbi:hypothetical protein ACFRAO_31385 [Streptomyces sp. NPDC056656]|uniref:hypothetical protein n=1 Tax=Streptomyces sp. NPDC056656 TaxID=3345895 RepID=UPI0036959ED7
MLTPSSTALPQLLSEGFVTDAALVDGSHRFHEVFVDLYFLRKIVRPEGLVVIDDDSWPSGTHGGAVLRAEHGMEGDPRRFSRRDDWRRAAWRRRGPV